MPPQALGPCPARQPVQAAERTVRG